MSYTRLPYGVVEKHKLATRLNLPRNYGAGQYFKRL